MVIPKIDGKPALTPNAGDPLPIPAGQIHDARNVGGGASRIRSTYMVEKGRAARHAGAPA